jgi:hypothetical protein
MFTTEVTKPQRGKNNVHYVCNKDFLAAIVEYRKKVFASRENGTPPPQIPDYIGDCLLKMATRYSYKPNFANYSYRDEMISDAVENSIQYFMNFDPAKSSNPFAYFTTVIDRAFIRRINKEKRQVEAVEKLLERNGFDEVFTDDNTVGVNNYSEYNSIKDSVQSRMR